MPNTVETIELLESFRELPIGWNFGSGKPSATVAFEQSKVALSLAYSLGLNEMEAFPGNDGEIQLNVYKDDANLELMFEIDGTIDVTFEEGDTYVCLRHNSSLIDVFKYLKELQHNKCRSSVSLISQNTTVLSMEGLKAPHSNPQAMVPVFPSSAKNAAKNTVAQFVPTLQNIIRPSPVPRTSFGKYRLRKSQRPALSFTA